MSKRSKAGLLALLAIIVIAAAGYQVGKDMALRDNQRDAAMASTN